MTLGPSQAFAETAGAKVILKERIAKRVQQAANAKSLEAANALSKPSQARMDARLVILNSFDRFFVASGLSRDTARFAYAMAYPDVDGLDSWVREQVSAVSVRTLNRWESARKNRGITALAGDFGNRRGTGKLDADEALINFVESMLTQFPTIQATHLMKAIQVRYADLDLPSLRGLQRWIADWRQRNAQTLRSITNPDAWKNKDMAAFGSESDGIVRLNQRWELDSTPADVLLVDGRYCVLGVVDVYSRRAKLLVSKTSKAVAVAALLRAALLDWGAPEICKTDNGSDYVSHHITRVLAALGIDHAKCPPFQPWRKPHIESFFGTFSHDLLELCPGYIGHDVAERKAIEARRSFSDRLMKRNKAVELRMTGAELQRFCDEWTDNVYSHSAHDGLKGRTPWQMAAEWAEPVRRIDDERALDVLLAEAPENNGLRTVQKKGIRLDAEWFIAPELGAWIGRPVQVRYDALQHDLGRIVVYGDGPDGLQFVCIAECPERTGMDRREVAIKAKSLQLANTQAERARLKAMARKLRTGEVLDELLRDRAEAAGKLITLPRAAETHTSPGLAAAGEAARAITLTERSAASLDIEEAQQLAQTHARIKALQVPRGEDNELARRRGLPIVPLFDSIEARVRWLLEQAHLRALSTEEQDTLAQFKAERRASYLRMADAVNEQAEKRLAREASRKDDAPAATGAS